jgi:hypothetical protein
VNPIGVAPSDVSAAGDVASRLEDATPAGHGPGLVRQPPCNAAARAPPAPTPSRGLSRFVQLDSKRRFDRAAAERWFRREAAVLTSAPARRPTQERRLEHKRSCLAGPSGSVAIAGTVAAAGSISAVECTSRASHDDSATAFAFAGRTPGVDVPAGTHRVRSRDFPDASARSPHLALPADNRYLTEEAHMPQELALVKGRGPRRCPGGPNTVCQGRGRPRATFTAIGAAP